MTTAGLNKYINKKVKIVFKEFSGYPPLEGILKKEDNKCLYKYLYYINVDGSKYYFRVSHIERVEVLYND